jgi:hypothetical protein
MRIEITVRPIPIVRVERVNRSSWSSSTLLQRLFPARQGAEGASRVMYSVSSYIEDTTRSPPSRYDILQYNTIVMHVYTKHGRGVVRYMSGETTSRLRKAICNPHLVCRGRQTTANPPAEMPRVRATPPHCALDPTLVHVCHSKDIAETHNTINVNELVHHAFAAFSR